MKSQEHLHAIVCALLTFDVLLSSLACPQCFTWNKTAIALDANDSCDRLLSPAFIVTRCSCYLASDDLSERSFNM